VNLAPVRAVHNFVSRPPGAIMVRIWRAALGDRCLVPRRPTATDRPGQHTPSPGGPSFAVPRAVGGAARGKSRAEVTSQIAIGLEHAAGAMSWQFATMWRPPVTPSPAAGSRLALALAPARRMRPRPVRNFQSDRWIRVREPSGLDVHR
jgi:hypothetical protein